ncbi:MAG: glycosyltransferase [Planctomycetaceae bacterium]
MQNSDANSDVNSPSQTSSKRLVFCITELDPGGAEKALVRIAVGLKDLGWDVSVVSLRDAGVMAQPLHAAGIPVTALKCGWFGDVRAVYRLTRHLIASPPEILLCFLHQANIVGRIVGRWLKLPRVVSGIRVADSRRWIIWSDRLTRRLVDHYVAVSDAVAELHSRLCGIPSSKISAIPNGVDLPAEPSRRVVLGSPSSFRILYVGRLTAQKSPQTLVEAFCRLSDGVRTATTLDFIGDGPQRSAMTRLIQQRGLSDRVRLLGHRDDVADFLQAADLLVLPSIWEGLPNVVLEAMAHRLPVVASDVDGVRDLIRDKDTGWLVPPGQPDDLAATITQVLQSPQLRAEVAENAFAMVKENFTWDAAIRKYDGLLCRLMKSD